MPENHINQPNDVQRVSRAIIEHRLLATLEDKKCVALLLTESDLSFLIASLAGYEVAEQTGNVLDWSKHIAWRNEFLASMQQLHGEAFPK